MPDLGVAVEVAEEFIANMTTKRPESCCNTILRLDLTLESPAFFLVPKFKDDKQV